jgi:hypothetical protein
MEFPPLAFEGERMDDDADGAALFVETCQRWDFFMHASHSPILARKIMRRNQC